ncbi:MAG: hypothetical protein P8M73_01390 [Luminiphilus sp.]|nr:hypothetical protein [Luminiphilus sp.]
MFSSSIFYSRPLVRRCLPVLFVGGLFAALGASAATLTITDDNGEKTPLEIQSGDYVRVTTASDGDVFLVLKGFSVTLGDGAGSTAGDSGGTGGDSGGTGGDSGGSGGTAGDVPTEGYCADYDPSQADCQAEQNFDPWIAGTGEKPYWIRSGLTEVLPFTLPSRSEALDTRYGYLHLTTGERKRNTATEDIFHMWFSETPHGPVLEGTKCEWYGAQAKTQYYWTQDASLAREMCDLGTASRTLYVNFETRCYEPLYGGTCSDTNKQKSAAKYQFDVSRRIKGY